MCVCVLSVAKANLVVSECPGFILRMGHREQSGEAEERERERERKREREREEVTQVHTQQVRQGKKSVRCSSDSERVTLARLFSSV